MGFRGPLGPIGQRRNYSQTTVTGYIKTVADFAKYFQRSPDQLGPDEIRQYQLYLLNERKQGVRTVGNHTAALRFFFCKTLKRNYPIEEVPYPKAGRKLPVILTQEEAVRLIDCASNLFHRAMLMTLYSTGMRRAELCHLKVADIDSERMVIHIRHGKRNRDRDVPLSPKLLETLREYWRWMHPKTYLFPGTKDGWRADKPITPKVLWEACREAAHAAGISKDVRPHLLRHYLPFRIMSGTCHQSAEVQSISAVRADIVFTPSTASCWTKGVHIEVRYRQQYSSIPSTQRSCCGAC
jgi:integrase